MVRTLQPTEYGYPIEIYVYANDTRWADYEYIQAAVFDHITAAASYFDLELCELTGSAAGAKLTHSSYKGCHRRAVLSMAERC